MKKILSIFVVMIYLTKSFSEERKIGNFIINVDIEGQKISDYFRDEDFENLNNQIDNYKKEMNLKDYNIKINICKLAYKEVNISNIKLDEDCEQINPSFFTHILTFNKIGLINGYHFLRYSCRDIYEKINETKFLLKKGKYDKNKETLEKCFLGYLDLKKVLLKEETLTAEEIKDIRKKIEKIEDEEIKKEYYLLLQEKIPYHSQKDNLYFPNVTCNQTSLAMCLVGLGISNPSTKLQFEDYLEELRKTKLDKDKDDRTFLGTRIKLLGLMGVKYNDKIKDIENNFTLLKEKLQPELEKGNTITFSYGSHIVRLVKFTQDGLYVDDPYGCLYSERDLLKRQELKKNTFCNSSHIAKDCPVNTDKNKKCGTNSKDNKNLPGMKCFWEKTSVDKLRIYNILVVKP